MKTSFKKYQGTGNDFVIIDNRNNLFDKSNLEKVQLLCDRKFGVGSDGLILIEDHDKFDFNMIFYNPDGSQSFCGNGSRCAVQFVHDLGIISKDKTEFISTDGWHEAQVLGSNTIKLKMHDVSDVKSEADFDFMNTGSPHYVSFKNNLASFDIIEAGSKIRFSKDYEKIGGTNVNFIEKKGNDYLVRTYERGVENETLSCGTGVTAAALSIAIKYETPSGKVNIETKGGKLTVSFDKLSNTEFKNIWLKGPANFVFDGVIDI